MDETKLINICRGLGIRGKDGKFPKDLNFVVDDKQLGRLLHSKVVSNERLKGEVLDSHKQVMAEYKDILTENKDTYDKAKNPGLSETRKDLVHIDREVRKNAKIERARMRGVNSDDVNTYFQFQGGALNNIDRNRAQRIDQQQIALDKKLNAEYKNLDKIVRRVEVAKKAGALGKITEARFNRKIEKLENRIARLQTKQGKLDTRQTMIVNRATKRYVDKVTREQNKYRRESQRVDRYVERVNAATRTRDELIRENARVQSNLGMSGLNPLDRAAMRINGAVINARVGNLERRIGAMNLGEQIARSTSGFRL